MPLTPVADNDLLAGPEWPRFIPTDGLLHVRVGRVVPELISTEYPNLETMQRLVGGYIELITFGKWRGVDVSLYCNEEGKIKGLYANNMATALAARMINETGGSFRDVVCGDCILMTGWVARADRNDGGI